MTHVTRKSSAFSLIELSLVILVIGILISGLVSSSNFIEKARLKTARTLTQSSPISSIKNLVAWWETTSNASFKSTETEHNTKITTWYDINPQSTQKLSLSQNNSSNQPTYEDSGINNLPALHFNGSSSYVSIPFTQALNPNEMSIFAVVKLLNVDNFGTIISSRDDLPLQGYMLYVTESTGLYQIWSGDGNVDWQPVGTSSASLETAELISFSKSDSTVNIYKNGVNVDSEPQILVKTSTNELRVGAGRNEDTADYFLNGYIGELVVFDRVLKKAERQAIENYLSQKWTINITQN